MILPLLLALSLLLPSLSAGEPLPEKTAPLSEFDRLRQERPMLRDYFESLASRTLANHLAAEMTRRGFPEEQIRAVLSSPSFSSFSRRVLADGRSQRAMNRFLDRLLAPGALEAMVRKKSVELATRRQAAMALAVEDLVRAQQQRILSEETHPTKEGFWSRIWKSMIRDLL
jgi:hypothetical protein